jgi:hypothetical protein
MLTAEQTEQLEKPFRLEEHRFKGKTPYIMKDAIRRRLDSVVPGWSMTTPEFVLEMNDVIVFRAGMTVCGDTRWATGTGTIQRYSKNKDTDEYIERNPDDIARETAKAVKSADSDLLPRCASKFGVGDYLRNLTQDQKAAITNMTALKKFLDELNRPVQPPHWALNGGGQRINAKMKTLKLEVAYVLQNAEPGHTLARLSDTSLTEEQFSARLDELAATLVAAGGGSSTTPKSEAASTAVK